MSQYPELFLIHLPTYIPSLVLLSQMGTILGVNHLTSSPVSFQGFTGAYDSSFTLGAQNVLLYQVRCLFLALWCQISPKGNCSMWSYRFPNAIGFGRLEETVTYLSPSLCQFFRRTKWHSSSKLEVPFYHLLLEFCKKTKRFSFGKRLKVGCPKM